MRFLPFLVSFKERGLGCEQISASVAHIIALVLLHLRALLSWVLKFGGPTARCENVVLKLGGLTPPTEMAMHMSRRSAGPISSEQLAGLWLPYHDHALKTFGPHRCMFESCVAAPPRICAASDLTARI